MHYPPPLQKVEANLGYLNVRFSGGLQSCNSLDSLWVCKKVPCQFSFWAQNSNIAVWSSHWLSVIYICYYRTAYGEKLGPNIQVVNAEGRTQTGTGTFTGEVMTFLYTLQIMVRRVNSEKRLNAHLLVVT